MTTNNKRRIMGSLCLNGDAEAAANTLLNAGFGVRVDGRDEYDTRFMMFWIDAPRGISEAGDGEWDDVFEFVNYVSNLIGEMPDNVAYVGLDHVPASFGDFGGLPIYPRGSTKAAHNNLRSCHVPMGRHVVLAALSF
jgi:hypothetical protein